MHARSHIFIYVIPLLIQCILGYPNPIGQVAKKKVRISEIHVQICDMQMHAVLQRYFVTYPLFGRCVKFPSLSLSTIVHLTRAEYHNDSHSHEKTRRC